MLKKVLIGLALTGSAAVAPVVPAGDMTLLYSYQYPAYEVDEKVTLSATATTSERVVTRKKPERPNFADDNKDGMISVSVFADKSGKKVEVQIPEKVYEDMRKVGGYAANPKKTDFVSPVRFLFAPEKAKALDVIAFDAASTANVSGTSLTYSQTNSSGNNRLLFVSVVTNTAPTRADYVTGITYNGVAMTRSVAVTSGSGNQNPIFLYWLAAPATGANNVVVSVSSSVSIYSVAANYTGASQTGPDTGVTNQAVLTSPLSTNVNVVSANSWVISAAGEGTIGSPAASTNLPSTRSSQTFESVTADSNAPIAAGTYAVSWVRVGGDMTVVAAPFGPGPDVVVSTAPNLSSLIMFQ